MNLARAVPSAIGRRFRDLSVLLKINLAVGLAVVVALVVGLLGLAALSSEADRTRAMYEQNTVGVQLAQEARYQYIAFRFASLNRTTAPTPEVKAQYQAQRDAAETALAGALDALRTRTSPTGAVLAGLDQVQSDVATYFDLAAQLDRLAAEGRVVEFNQLRETQVGPLSGQVVDGLTALSAAAQDAAQDGATAAADAQSRTATLLLVVLVVGAVLALLVGVGVALGIRRSLVRVRAAVQRLADGDLTRATGLDQRDDVGRTAAALDEAVLALRDVVTTVAASADAVAASSEELSASSAQIAASAGETSAQSGMVAGAAGEVSRNVQTVAAGADEMGASIREIAQNANEAARVAAAAVAEAETTTATVSRLGDSSREIGDVVKVITTHRRADQPAGAQRHDRGRPGRRGGQGLRRRRQRGEGAGPGDGEGHRGHRPPRRGHPGRHLRGGRAPSAGSARSSARSTTTSSPSPARSRSRRRRRRRCRARSPRPRRAPGRSRRTSAGSPRRPTRPTRRSGRRGRRSTSSPAWPRELRTLGVPLPLLSGVNCSHD